MFIAEGVSIVFHEELKSFGVAFSSQKALVKNTPPLQDLYCYGFSNKADYRYPPKLAGQLLFIPFSAMAEKSLNPVAVVESSILKPTQSQNASHFDKSNCLTTASNSDYLPAYVLARKDIGLVFPSYDKVCAFMFKYDDLFDDDDNIPDFSEDQVVFLSMTSMLSHGKAKFAVYRKEELSVYYQILEVTNYAQSSNLPVTNCSAETAIACIDKNNDSGRTPHAACNAGPFKSEGLTTGATEESERVDARLESTKRISSDAIEMSSAGGNHLRVPGPSDIWKDTGYDVYSTGRENAAPRVRSQAGGRGGGVELSTVESAAEFYRRNWGVLKKAGWKCIHFKSSILLYVGKEIEVYMTPMIRSNINTNLNKLNAVENVEFFYSKVALRAHVMDNPCLLVDSRELRAFLSSAGWVEVHADDGRTKNNYCPSYYTLSFAKKYLKNDGLNELMPGLHKFTSFASLAVYIHRFPFLLQSEEAFISTLKRLNWVVNEKKKVRWTADDSSRLHATLNLNACGLSGQTVVWMSLELLKQLFWMDPASLFLHTSCAHAILDSIRLDTDFASSPDPGPFSPFVEGLTRAERDALLIELARLFQNQGSKKYTQKSAEVDEASISRHLQNLHWKHEPASFLKSALKCEPAWIAPWLSTTIGDGDEPQLGRDYFWTLTALGKFVDACGMEAILRKPKPSKTINKSESVNDQASLLNFKLRSLANIQQRSAKDDTLMTELLELSGWKIQHRDNGESLYIPGWSVASKAGYDWNLRDCRVGYDFFESRDDAIDHLASHGNVPVEAVVTSDQETESASSPCSMDSQIKAASQSDTSCDVIHHLRKDYNSSSHEGLIIQNLRGGRWFPTIMKNLRCLGWFTSYDKVAKITVICAPWALENVPAAFPNPANTKTVTTSSLNVNSDYFLDSDEGKTAMYKYLLEVGFARICDNQLKDGGLRSLASSMDAVDKLGESSDSPILKKARLSSSSTKKHSVNHLGVEYDLNTHQGKVVETLAQQKPYFGVIYDNLKKLGWTSHYEKTLKATLICAPWAQDVPEAFEENKKCRLQNFTLLKENVDYFVDSECGKKALIDYLQRFGFNRSSPIDIDSNKKRKHVVSQEADTDSVPLKFKAISPQNPCYRAADPSKAIIRHISDVQSPEISSIPIIASCEDVDYDDLQAIMSLQSPTADDRVVSENEERCELFHLLLHGERDIGKILSYLRPLGWTWNYPNKRLAALGYSVIYLRPGCSMADEAKLIRHEDIFYSSDELVEYLLNQFGIKTDIVDELAPRRITRYGKSSGTFHRDPVAGSPLVILSKASNVIDRNGESKENLDKGETLSILDRINIAKKNLHLMTVGQVIRGTESCLAPIERSGSLKIIIDEIVDALKNARGAAIYVCGSPGVGKTLTVLTALKELACRYDQLVNLNRSIRASHSPPNSSSYASSSTELLGFNVVILNGADLIIAQKAFMLIAEEMNLFNGTTHRSDSMHLIFEHFRRGGAAFDFAAVGGSSSKKNCTLMTVLAIDELDLVHKDVLAHLMRCSCMAPSSLVLLGIGNNITLLRQSSAVQVVFEPYSPHELTSILNRSTANIFTRNAAALLVGKVLRNNKGDVRALLNIAEMSIKVAERDAHTERREILGFDKTTHLVDISHVRQVCEVKDRTVELIDGLTMKSKTLMVVSLLLSLDQWHDGMLSLSLLTNAYNSFAIQKGISTESACGLQRMLDELQAYCIMETTNHRSSAKANYRLLVDASVAIQADLGSILLFELKQAMTLAEQRKKETL